MIKSTLFLLSVLLFACLQGQTLTIEQVKALNLEEDKGPFATFNDEVLLICASYSYEYDSLLSWEFTPIYVLSDSLNSVKIDLSISLTQNEDGIILLALVEVDTDLEAAELSKKMKDAFLSYKNYPLTLVKEKLNLALGDDDLLLTYFFKTDQISNVQSPLLGRGMQFFNRFEYEFVLSVE